MRIDKIVLDTLPSRPIPRVNANAAYRDDAELSGVTQYRNGWRACNDATTEVGKLIGRVLRNGVSKDGVDS
jgi:hypothetical protein